MANGINPNEDSRPFGDEASLFPFISRRSVVYSTDGMVACSQPLAAEAGQRILRMGGNAAASLMDTNLEPRETLTSSAGCSSGSRYVVRIIQ